MSPTTHLPTGLSSIPLITTAAAILFILLIMTGLSLVYLSAPTASIYGRHFYTHTHILAQLSQTVSLATLASIVSCIYSSLSLALEQCLHGPFEGVGEKRSSETPLQMLYFTLLCLQIPQAVGSCFLGFTPGSRPSVRGPAPLPLTKLGFPSRVGGKRASEALISLLAMFSLISVKTQRWTNWIYLYPPSVTVSLTLPLFASLMRTLPLRLVSSISCILVEALLWLVTSFDCVCVSSD